MTDVGKKRYIWNFDLKIPLGWVTNNKLKDTIRNFPWRSTFYSFDRGHLVVLIIKLQVYIHFNFSQSTTIFLVYTGCFTTLGHNCRR